MRDSLSKSYRGLTLVLVELSVPLATLIRLFVLLRALVDDMGASPAVAAVAEVREEAERSAEEEDNNSMADMISGAMLPSSLRSSLSMSP
jgi:hypothetical protein